MQAEGHEVGVHTLTHVNLANVSSPRLRAELAQTQLAIAAATGHTTNLLRPPYSSQVEQRPAPRSGRRSRARRTTASSTPTSTPRTGPDPAPRRSSQAGVPQNGQGAVVMLHDGGGDRAQTVAAVDLLIAELQQRGYTFDTVSSAIQTLVVLAPGDGVPARSGHAGERLRPGVRPAGGLGEAGVHRARGAGDHRGRSLLLVMARRHRRQHATGPDRSGISARPSPWWFPRTTKSWGSADGQIAGRQRLSRSRHHRGRRRVHATRPPTSSASWACPMCG